MSPVSLTGGEGTLSVEKMVISTELLLNVTSVSVTD